MFRDGESISVLMTFHHVYPVVMTHLFLLSFLSYIGRRNIYVLRYSCSCSDIVVSVNKHGQGGSHRPGEMIEHRLAFARSSLTAFLL